MKIVYKDIPLRDYDKNSVDLPLRFRMKLRRIDDYFLIEREYFKSGFHDGEDDDFVFAYYRGYHVKSIDTVSLMTQKVNDVEYLKSFEKILIQAYINHCESLIPEFTRYLQKETNNINDEIREYTKSLKFLSNYDRIEKLKKINIYDKT